MVSRQASRKPRLAASALGGVALLAVAAGAAATLSSAQVLAFSGAVVAGMAALYITGLLVK
jgi:hypothetical protein